MLTTGFSRVGTCRTTEVSIITRASDLTCFLHMFSPFTWKVHEYILRSSISSLWDRAWYRQLYANLHVWNQRSRALRLVANSPLGFMGKAAFFYESTAGTHGSVVHMPQSFEPEFPYWTDTCFKSSSFAWFKVFFVITKIAVFEVGVSCWLCTAQGARTKLCLSFCY